MVFDGVDLQIPDFISYTIGIIVYFIGMHLNHRVRLLQEYNIPEPVTGGLLAALVVFGLHSFLQVDITFDLESRDMLLIYFFTSIGLNARMSDLIAGGRPLGTLLGLTMVFILIQSAVGIGGATLLGLPVPAGVLVGTASLIGGHGTAIAWAPEIAAEHGIANALEIGVASATLGLVIASLIGGPIAKYLLGRYALSGPPDDEPIVGISHENESTERINHVSIMSVLLTLHVSIIIGYVANQAIAEAGLRLPLFVTCLLTAILLSNTVPVFFPRMRWPARTRALAVVSDFSLGIFLAMSLMSMQLWTIAGLAGPLLLILALHTLAALVFVLFLVFPLMGRDYQAAVLSAGFGGIALGATPTAIANMTAVTKTHGPAPMAFIIVPLVSAFFVDIANAIVIQTALNL